MRKVAALSFVSLDGVMQAPAHADEDRSGNFSRGGWAMPWWTEVMEQVREEAMAEPYDLLLGGKTYDIFAPHWQAASNSSEARKLNHARKYVATSRPAPLSWNNSVAIPGRLADTVRELKMSDGPLLQIHGSGRLIHYLLGHHLIDEFRIWTFPIILGTGKRLFPMAGSQESLTLIKSGRTTNGVIMSIYRRP